MKKILLITVFCFGLNSPKAFSLFGADAAMSIPYYIQMIAEAVKQYQQLQLLVGEARQNKELLKKINEGLDHAISLVERLPIKDENVLGNLKNFRQAIQEIQNIYGSIPKSNESKMHLFHDQSIAESLRIYAQINNYSSKQEQNAEKIRNQSHNSSPKGSGRITAQANAEILHTLNQLLKVNGQILKIQSELLGVFNKDGKDSVSNYLKVQKDINSSFGILTPNFETPIKEKGKE